MKGKRKYLSEFAISLFSTRWLMIPANQVSSGGTMNSEHQEISDRCHIYLICKQPSLFYEKESFSYANGIVSGNLIYKDINLLIRIPFSRQFPLYDGAVTLGLCDYPHREIQTIDGNGEVVRILPASLMAQSIKAHLNDKALSNLEVLYVGQSFGDGSRSAFNRLTSHSTLQKILADVQYSCPDYEVWVLTFEYDHYRVFSSFDGRTKGTIRGKVDSARFHSVLENPLTEHQQVCLIEAGLIRLFMPTYNEIYKESFPSATHKILASCFRLDFSGLVVEINTEELGFRLYSKNQPPRGHHLRQFELVHRSERAGFFSFEDKEGVVHTPEEIIALT